MKTYNLDALPGSLLTTGNPKTVKGEKLNYLTAIMHLAPAELSGRNVCAHSSAGCRAACLNTAGRGGFADPRYESILNGIQVARIQRTRWFTRDKEAFMVQLADEISRHVARAIRLKLKPCVRLNGTSDLKWEDIKLGAFPNIFAMFPDIQFYDYTKWPVWKRAKARTIPNYHLTFSLSEENDADAYFAVQNGVNVAVAMNVKRSGTLPRTFAFTASQLSPLNAADTFDVLDGDKTDLRFLDAAGCIVGLRAKGRGKQDESGFVRNVNV